MASNRAKSLFGVAYNVTEAFVNAIAMPFINIEEKAKVIDQQDRRAGTTAS
jgi:hypothetical protein